MVRSYFGVGDGVRKISENCRKINDFAHLGGGDLQDAKNDIENERISLDAFLRDELEYRKTGLVSRSIS